MPRTTPSRLLIAAVLAVLLHGCATTPTPGPPTPAPSPALTEAARLAGDGRMDAAAARLEQAAGEASSPARANALRLQAAILYARAGDDATASTLRDDVGDADAGEAGAGLRLLLRMRLDGETLAPATVIRRLTPVPDGLAPPVAAAWLDQRAEARRAGGEPLAAARDLIRAQVLSGRTDGARSERIWSILQQIPPDRLEQAAGRADSGAEAGWLSLANRVRDAGDDTDAVASAVSSWHSLYPDHPASDFADQLVERRRAALAPPKRIALLLPLSGDLAEVGKAIRDGFLTAYYAAGDERPALDILDTKGSVAGAVAAYQHAGNADMVVGPLTKAGVRAVSSRRNDDRQVLTLNTVDGESSPEGVYHFGLSPEDDARTAARAAWASGKDRAVVLVPTGEWGSRVAGAYTEAFEDLGGKILETARYPEDESDYSTTLRQLFNLDVSERRYRELRRLLRRDIEFSPRRRQDMQAVFIG
ncbi:penicillin-binding protein activator, partial [Arhodomonas sp. KWT]